MQMKELEPTSWVWHAINLAALVLPLLQLIFILRVQVELDKVFETIASDATASVTRSDIIDSSRRTLPPANHLYLSRRASASVKTSETLRFDW